MSIFDKSIIKTEPLANPNSVIKGDKFRITVLTSRLLRLEYSENGVFEDRATKLAVCRNFETPEFEVKETDKGLEVITEYLHMFYDKKPFSYNGLQIKKAVKTSLTLGGGKGNVWHYGEDFETLDGTYRTLDGVDGDVFFQDRPDEDTIKKLKLGKSLMNPRTGLSVIDDSETLALNDDGWAVPVSKDGRTDIYIFYYWKDYKACLKDYYKLTGATPLLPRYALGNWWSRYYRYSEESYCRLLDRFEQEGIPFSVGVIDMDWHRTVDIPKEYGEGWYVGWTGYSWDKNLFPNPERFLNYVHNKGLKTTLNLHPADGIRGFEDLYPQIAEAMGVNTDKKEPVEFDITSPKFMDNYFKLVLNELEEQGVDFWWIDWQQGGFNVNGYDTLWMLNHYHFIDSARRGERPLTFSRYAEFGSHRYPVGFSGDTIVSWESLAYQPYFTNCATNVGYGWWSHDIGGHMLGIRNGDLTSRWVQLGVFSPINRLHATNDNFGSKEPWEYSKETELSMKKFLKLRHKLVPYLYTMNERAHSEGLPIVLPLYYEEPDAGNLYRHGNRDGYNKGKSPFENQYYFGTQFLVSPIVTPTDKTYHLAKVYTYLPAGKWIDFFNGMIYNGGKALNIHRAYDEMPVFVRPGAIVPLAHDDVIGNLVDNPTKFQVKVFGGADGSFTMYEDNDKVEKHLKSARTTFTFTSDKQAKFVIEPIVGDSEVVPQKRDYVIEFFAIEKPDSVTVGGKKVDFTFDSIQNKTTVEANGVNPADRVEIVVENSGEMPKNNIEKPLFKMINAAEISLPHKNMIFGAALNVANGNLGSMITLTQLRDEKQLPGISLLIDAIIEMIFADK